MGVAAYNRASKVVSTVIHADADLKRELDDLARALEIAEACNAFVTAAMSYMVEPRGLREVTVLQATQRRGWGKRNAAVIKAHNAWVDGGYVSTKAFAQLSIARARAVFALFSFALGTWTIPHHIEVPRAAR